MSRIVIIGGGPAGYESALVAARLGAEVTLVEREGAGGACVLADCVPSKTYIASSDAATALHHGDRLGIRSAVDDHAIAEDEGNPVRVRVGDVHTRVHDLARAQSADVAHSLAVAGVELVIGSARLDPVGAKRFHRRVAITPAEGEGRVVDADMVLLATGATPRVLAGAEPDGQRILSWRQLYDLTELPQHLIVVGSGVTGAEFASAYRAMGSQVTLVSSRDRVMPHEDSDAANLIEDVFSRRGMEIISHARAKAVINTGDGVRVELVDGRTVAGSHALMTVGSVPNTADLGLDEAGVELTSGGHIKVDRVSRTTVPGIYAAGDCTGVLMLASVAGMQGRIAVAHALGEELQPLRLRTVASNVFTEPEIAAVGIGQSSVQSEGVSARTVTLPLSGNARAKMAGMTDGFVKIFCRSESGLVIGGVVVGPSASELILPVTMAVENHLTVAQLANSITIYPSMSGSVTEAARQLVQHEFE